MKRRHRIGLLATHYVGDTFWALQTIPFLERRLPTAEIHVLVRPSQRWLAACWAEPHCIHPVKTLVSDRHREGRPRPWTIYREGRRLRRRLGRFDLLIDLTGTSSSAFLTRALAPHRAIGLAGRPIYSLAYDAARPVAEFTGHLAERPWWLLESEFAPGAAWPDEELQRSPTLPSTALRAPVDEGVTVLLPGAGWPEKRWPIESFARLARLLIAEDLAVRILFAENERVLAAEQANLLADLPTEIIRITRGADFLGDLASAAAVVANDSGGAHLAAALGKPTVALFGPTNPNICGPLGPQVEILCTSCDERPRGTQHHCKNRPGHTCGADCLAGVTPEEVLAHLQPHLTQLAH